MEKKFGWTFKNAYFELREDEHGEGELWVVENLKDDVKEKKWMDVIEEIGGLEDLTININHTNKGE